MLAGSIGLSLPALPLLLILVVMLLRPTPRIDGCACGSGGEYGVDKVIISISSPLPPLPLLLCSDDDGILRDDDDIDGW